MGFLRRLLGSSPELTTAPEAPERLPTFDLGDRRGDLPADGFALASGPGMEVVGESHYREAITAIVGGRRQEAVKLVTWAALVPEPENTFDPNAIGVRIGGVKVGHLSRGDAAAFGPVLARLGAVGLVGHGRADIYGGWDRGPNDRGDYGITLYIGSPEKQGALLDRKLDGKSAAEIAVATPALRPGRGRGPGMVRGRPHPDWHEEVKRLEQVGDEPAAEVLLIEICDATEAESQAEGYGVAPAAYEHLAVIYRRRNDQAAEIAILERYEAAPKAPGATPAKLAERLAKLRG
jgi:hypothetical protein